MCFCAFCFHLSQYLSNQSLTLLCQSPTIRGILRGLAYEFGRLHAQKPSYTKIRFIKDTFLLGHPLVKQKQRIKYLIKRPNKLKRFSKHCGWWAFDEKKTYEEAVFISSKILFWFVPLSLSLKFKEAPISGCWDIPLLISEVVFHWRLSSFQPNFYFGLVS